MRTYSYKGRRPGGGELSGQTTAESIEGLRDKLLIESIILESQVETLSSVDNQRLRFVGAKEITRATRQLATLVSVGLTVAEAVESLAEEETLIRMAVVYATILHKLEAGEPFYQTLSTYPVLFNSSYVSLVEAGEASGKLPEILTKLAEHRERMDDLRRKLFTAMLYPSLVVTVSVLVLLAVLKYVIPVFSEMYAGFGAEMPELTAGVIAFSEALGAWFGTILISLSAIAITFAVLIRRPAIKTFVHRIALSIPVLGSIWKKGSLARYARTLGLLHSGGTDLLQSVAISAETVGNEFLRGQFKTVSARLEEGWSLRDSLAETGVTPSALLRMVSSGEKTGRLGEMLTNGASYYERELESNLTALTSVIEPIIILALGLVVGFLIIVMYLPLFDLISQIGP
ncbi:type II secretion system F family protein [bacterium AH-315-J21]|nr:type II secretion system F family protein [bacterium AH-315-J21]